MAVTERDSHKVNLTNTHGTLHTQLKQAGVNSIEKLHFLVENNMPVPEIFFKVVPLPIALIHNALVPESMPNMEVRQCIGLTSQIVPIGQEMDDLASR